MYIITRSPAHAPTLALETHLTYAPTHHRLYVSGDDETEIRYAFGMLKCRDYEHNTKTQDKNHTNANTNARKKIQSTTQHN